MGTPGEGTQNHPYPLGAVLENFFQLAFWLLES
jgi:hypothetical protein